jgi:hypothetical protein
MIDFNKIALYVSAGLAVVISVFGLVGLLESVPWLRERIDLISLLLISLLILFLTTDVDRRLAKLEKQGERAAQMSLENALDEVVNRLPATLRKLFAPVLKRSIDRLKQATTGKVLLEPVEHFPHFYRETLATFSSEHFSATSLASREFFWKNAATMDAIKTFIRGGGSMHRIFFLDSAADEEGGEVREIIKDQLSAGVKVFTVDSTNIPGEWQKYFVVAQKEDLAWTSAVSPGRRIASVEAISDPKEVDAYRLIFDHLRHDPSLKGWREEDGLLVAFNPHHRN